MSPFLPSGEQLEITCGQQRVTIVEVGGGIREYFHGERPVLDPYPPEAICDGAHGAPLIPWPNRLRDGRYSFDGQEHQLAITEPDRGNAIHGLLRWRNWQALEHSADRVVMATRLHPLEGWPFALDVSISYVLNEQGLSVTTAARNIGPGPCPFASGQHPYLSAGEGAVVDECTLQLAARTRILTDPVRQLPIGREPVPGGDFDFHSARRLGQLRVDDPFADLERDGQGRAWVRLGCPDGRTVELWCDESYAVVELYTGDTLAPERRRRAVAAEPMTCPPDALHSGESVIRLAPGQAQVSRWGVALTG